jgi:hypothetical protein
MALCTGSWDSTLRVSLSLRSRDTLPLMRPYRSGLKFCVVRYPWTLICSSSVCCPSCTARSVFECGSSDLVCHKSFTEVPSLVSLFSSLSPIVHKYTSCGYMKRRSPPVVSTKAENTRLTDVSPDHRVRRNVEAASPPSPLVPPFG